MVLVVGLGRVCVVAGVVSKVVVTVWVRCGGGDALVSWVMVFVVMS